MKSFGSHNSFLTILLESIRLLPKNGKLMALAACFSIFFSLCSLSLFGYSVEFVADDMFVIIQKSFMPNPDSFNSSDPTSFQPKMGFDLAEMMGPFNKLKGDLAILFAVEIAYFLAFSTIFFFSSISTIIVSAFSHSDKNLSLKELFSIILKTWTRPLITSFYVSCLSIGYFAIGLILASPLLMHPNISTFWVAIFVGFPSSVLYLYLVVPWIISIVISVIEESCYGMEALGKATELVEGKRLHGFLLNVFYGLLVLIIFKAYTMLTQNKGYIGIALILLTIVLSLVNIFQTLAHTALYLQCKEHHGEEIELRGSVKYSKLPTTVAAVVLGKDMP